MKIDYENIFKRYDTENQIQKPLTSNAPLVSILMGYYDKTAYLEDCLNSIQEQTYQNWELIIVNDASPDEPSGILEKFSNDTRICYHKLDHNGGSAKARNHAFQHSHGEYILVFDADDIMHPMMLQQYVDRMQRPDNPDIVMANIILFGEKTDERYVQYAIHDECSLTKEQWIPTPSLVKRYLWEATGGLPTSDILRRGAEDWELWLHIFELFPAVSVALLERPLMLYRQVGNSLSSQKDLFAYQINREVLARRKRIFLRNNTQEYVICDGYQLSIIARIKSGAYLSALRLLCEGPTPTLSLFLIKKVLKKMAKRIPLLSRRFMNAV